MNKHDRAKMVRRMYRRVGRPLGTKAMKSTTNTCGHRRACTYGRADYKRDVCQVWWCHQCGALAIRRVQGGRPKRGDWWLVIGKRAP